MTEPPRLSAIDTFPFDALLAGIDQGMQAHLGWNQRLLRCALLLESPGDDVLLPDASRRCQLGVWFDRERAALDSFAPAVTAEIAEVHGAMHDAVRAMCRHVLGGTTASPDDLETYQRSQITMVALLGQLRDRIAETAGHHDSLTGLPLRHGLTYAFDLRQKDAERSGGALHLAMIDVDHFKRVNDTYGHQVGDLAIKHVASHLRASLRSSDAVFRFGGEEFLALILDDGGRGAEIAVDRLCHALRARPLHVGEHVLRLTVTVGLARVRDAEPLESAIERADLALRAGKEQGRDRVVRADPR